MISNRAATMLAGVSFAAASFGSANVPCDAESPQQSPGINMSNGFLVRNEPYLLGEKTALLFGPKKSLISFDSIYRSNNPAEFVIFQSTLVPDQNINSEFLKVEVKPRWIGVDGSTLGFVSGTGSIKAWMRNSDYLSGKGVAPEAVAFRGKFDSYVGDTAAFFTLPLTYDVQKGAITENAVYCLQKDGTVSLVQKIQSDYEYLLLENSPANKFVGAAFRYDKGKHDTSIQFILLNNKALPVVDSRVFPGKITPLEIEAKTGMLHCAAGSSCIHLTGNMERKVFSHTHDAVATPPIHQPSELFTKGEFSFLHMDDGTYVSSNKEKFELPRYPGTDFSLISGDTLILVKPGSISAINLKISSIEEFSNGIGLKYFKEDVENELGGITQEINNYLAEFPEDGSLSNEERNILREIIVSSARKVCEVRGWKVTREFSWNPSKLMVQFEIKNSASHCILKVSIDVGEEPGANRDENPGSPHAVLINVESVKG